MSFCPIFFLVSYVCMFVGLCADFAGCRMIIAAAFALNVAHPGPVFAGRGKRAAGVADPEAEAVYAREGK